MMTETLKNQKALIDAGFSESDIASWQAEQRRALSDARYNQAQIDTEFGEPRSIRSPQLKAIRTTSRKRSLPRRWMGSRSPSKISWKH